MLTLSIEKNSLEKLGISLAKEGKQGDWGYSTLMKASLPTTKSGPE